MLHVKTGRKRICRGAEIVTSGEVNERMKENVSKYVKNRNRGKEDKKKGRDW